MNEEVWPHGRKLRFHSFADLEKYFENGFEMWKENNMGTKVIGMVLYIFRGHHRREEGEANMITDKDREKAREITEFHGLRYRAVNPVDHQGNDPECGSCHHFDVIGLVEGFAHVLASEREGKVEEWAYLAVCKADREKGDKIKELEAEVERFKGYACPDCGGEGSLGRSDDGRLISCETCGGHEDALGSGRVENPLESELREAKAEDKRMNQSYSSLRRLNTKNYSELVESRSKVQELEVALERFGKILSQSKVAETKDLESQLHDAEEALEPFAKAWEEALIVMSEGGGHYWHPGIDTYRKAKEVLEKLRGG